MKQVRPGQAKPENTLGHKKSVIRDEVLVSGYASGPAGKSRKPDEPRNQGALHELALKMLPQYEADDGPLTATQLRQIKKRVPQGSKRSVRSSLFDTENA